MASPTARVTEDRLAKADQTRRGGILEGVTSEPGPDPSVRKLPFTEFGHAVQFLRRHLGSGSSDPSGGSPGSWAGRRFLLRSAGAPSLGGGRWASVGLDVSDVVATRDAGVGRSRVRLPVPAVGA